MTHLCTSRIFHPAQKNIAFDFFRLDRCEDEMRKLVQHTTYRGQIKGTISETIKTGIFTRLPVNMIRYAVCNTHLDRLMYLIHEQGCEITIASHLLVADRRLFSKEYVKVGESVVFTTYRIGGQKLHSPDRFLKRGTITGSSGGRIEIATEDEVVGIGLGDLGGVWRDADSYRKSMRGGYGRSTVLDRWNRGKRGDRETRLYATGKRVSLFYGACIGTLSTVDRER